MATCIFSPPLFWWNHFYISSVLFDRISYLFLPFFLICILFLLENNLCPASGRWPPNTTHRWSNRWACRSKGFAGSVFYFCDYDIGSPACFGWRSAAIKGSKSGLPRPGKPSPVRGIIPGLYSKGGIWGACRSQGRLWRRRWGRRWGLESLESCNDKIYFILLMEVSVKKCKVIACNLWSHRGKVILNRLFTINNLTAMTTSVSQMLS